VLSFESLVNLANLVVILQYVSTWRGGDLAALQTTPRAERRFKIPFGISPVALIGCAVSLWLVKEVKTERIHAGRRGDCRSGLLPWRFSVRRAGGGDVKA